MSDKPKRVLTDEMKQKMLEGRKLANEKRKALKEAEAILKERKKADSVRAKQAIADQDAQASNNKIAKLEKEKVKRRLNRLKEDVVDVPTTVEEVVSEAIEVVSDSEEEEMTEEDMKNIVDELTDEQYEKLFKKKAKEIEKALPQEAKKLFKEAVNDKFNFNLNLEDNIKNMIKFVNQHVAVNTLATKIVRDKQKKKEEAQLQKEQVIIKEPEVAKIENTIDTNINMLMNLR
tara:strand:+ start:615 stop:1310 length:696 start_codon:yes stop_codon:yes gene_type:complete